MSDIFKWLFGKRGDAVQAGSINAIDDDDPRVPGFPPELLAYHKRIEATRLPILGATELEGVPDSRDGSQLGGLPWWPVDMAYPTDADGDPLHLLIQINFDEAPVLEGFPDKGILQVFIANDDLFGLADGTNRGGHACVYHETTEAEARTSFDDINWPDNLASPLVEPRKAVPLSLQRTTMIMDTTDVRFETAFQEIAADPELSELFAEINNDVPLIRLGGYPTFTQSDPRDDAESGIAITDVTLLTIDSTPNIMWGDVGVATFFIRPLDLETRDFSNVRYHWDCC